MKDYVTAKQRLEGLLEKNKSSDIVWTFYGLIGMYIFLMILTQPINGG